MAPALVLTEENAAEAGISQGGPIAFGGVFPGVYFVGEPVAISELGFVDEDEAREALEEAGVALTWTTVAEGEGKVFRPNHALGEREARQELAETAIEEAGGKITTHAEADAVAAELGITFPEGAKVAEKVEAIEAVRAGVTPGEAEAMIEATPEASAEEATP